jgi:hypothetical protein
MEPPFVQITQPVPTMMVAMIAIVMTVTRSPTTVIMYAKTLTNVMMVPITVLLITLPVLTTMEASNAHVTLVMNSILPEQNAKTLTNAILKMPVVMRMLNAQTPKVVSIVLVKMVLELESVVRIRTNVIQVFTIVMNSPLVPILSVPSNAAAQKVTQHLTAASPAKTSMNVMMVLLSVLITLLVLIMTVDSTATAMTDGRNQQTVKISVKM